MHISKRNSDCTCEFCQIFRLGEQKRKLEARVVELEHHAAALADAMDGYQECCGEDHPRPNFECQTCGKEERVLADYRAMVKP